MDSNQESGATRREGPRRHLRHHLARRRAMPRRHHDLRGEARGRRAARRDGRRYHRGRLSHRLPGRFRQRPGDRAPGEELGDLRACARANPRTSTSAPRPSSPRAQGRIHTFIGTSPLHRKYQMSIDEAEVLSRVTASVTRARGYTDNVEWSAMDATRTEHDFLCACVEAAIKAGATTVNIPDTVGYATPDEFAALIRMIVERVPNSDKAVFSTHCHNDLGLAVANSLAGVGAGRGRSNARSTGSASAPATPRSRRSSWRSGRAATSCRSGPASTSTMLTRASRLVSARHRLPGAIQQGDRRPERFCA